MRLTPLALALLAVASAPFGRAADFQGRPVQVPTLSAPLAPLAAAFPARTGDQFFAGAKNIVDLGGQPVSLWTKDLVARAPDARIHVVNIIPENVQNVREMMGTENLHVARYDFFAPPEDHPTGDRVLLNSPHFGGVRDDAQAAKVAEMIDRHMEPGGLFYAHADDMFFTTLLELQNNVLREFAFSHDPRRSFPPMSETIAQRERSVHAALVARFGRENVSRERLTDYDRGLLNAGESYTYQVRKPR